MGQEAMVIGMMVGRQLIPRWANDPVWLQNGSIRNSGQVWVWETPQEGNQGEGREGKRSAERVNNNEVAT